jgi:glutamate N-acetyltransferase / amino-acid N-acetyltransferase
MSKITKQKKIGLVPGFKAAGVVSGIKPSGAKDLTLIVSDVPAIAAGVFTKNRVQSPSVIYNKRRLAKVEKFKAVIVNSGNANACTGPQGMEDCKTICGSLAKELDIKANQTLIASTGIIGVPLPTRKITGAIPKLANSLSDKGWNQAAQGIMTTDLVSKMAEVRYKDGKKEIVLAGIAKGSGMIHPNMATMLGFAFTNANIDKKTLKKALQLATDASFNSITVDGECSTNDCVLVLANGLAGNSKINGNGASYKIFVAALTDLCQTLAQKIVRDGEGATKFVTIAVTGSRSLKEARKAGMRIATSNLVKTALFGEDPNWGRIVCAVGDSGVSLNPEKVSVAIEGQTLAKAGVPVRFPKKKVDNLMKKKEIQIEVDLGVGTQYAKVWTCDFSYDYVKINAEYTT